jgi:hypothetical protein
MIRDRKIRISPSGHVDDASRGLVEPICGEPKKPGLAALDRVRHDRTTNTHGVSA